ncbi:hypothetical protein [Streptomyces sp. NPDC050164]|uniref:hypothetical protein n=1 Tax=Streptomyces sp. NPDC050164 TaxID=3365605 RepID=UPI0037A32E75
MTGLDQDLDTVEGGAEADDRFGGSLALVQYRAGASANGTESILAVGSPGEDGSQAANAGRVDTFRLTATGFTQASGSAIAVSRTPSQLKSVMRAAAVLVRTQAARSSTRAAMPGKGTAELTQDLAAVPGGSEAKDRFGATLATYEPVRVSVASMPKQPPW